MNKEFYLINEIKEEFADYLREEIRDFMKQLYISGRSFQKEEKITLNFSNMTIDVDVVFENPGDIESKFNIIGIQTIDN